MSAFDVTPPGRLRRVIYLAALAVSVACLGWLVVDFVMAARGGEEPLGLLRTGLMLLLVPFGPSLFLIAVAGMLALSGRPAPASLQYLAVANAAWSVLLLRAVTMP